MKRALISIGVERPSGTFPALRGAVQDARDMHQWGVSQGMQCQLLVDADRVKVRVADAYEAIEQLLNEGTYSQIVIYFSGHGLLIAPDCELWLMSGAPTNPNEMINVPKSIINSRACGLEHVVFISDACRSLPGSLTDSGGGQGQVLFPYKGLTSPQAELDLFYATLPGDPAHELPFDDGNRLDGGLFTGCLLNALNGGVHDVLESCNIAGVANRVVPGRPLKIWLATAVPEEAERSSIALHQKPDIRIESDPRKFLAKFPEATLPVESDLPEQMSPQLGPYQRRRLVPSRGPVLTRPFGLPSSLTPYESVLETTPFTGEQEHVDRAVQIARSLGAEVALLGDKLALSAVWHRGTLAIQQTHEGVGLVRLPLNSLPGNDGQPASETVVLTLTDGSCIAIDVFRGYVAVVQLESTRVGSLNYVRSAMEASSFDLLGSEAIRLARRGQLTMDSDPVHRFVQDPLGVQSADPIVGALVGYTFARAGRHEDWAAIVAALRPTTVPLPVDMEILCAPGEAWDFSARGRRLPLLTEGWLHLSGRERHIPHSLDAARRFLVPSLWSTFSSTGAAALLRNLSGV